MTEEFVNLAQEPMSVQKASEVKSSLYDALPESSFNFSWKIEIIFIYFGFLFTNKY